MDSPLADVVQRYTELASSLLDDWRPHAAKVASKLDAGSYDADGAAADLGVCATLAADTSLRLAKEAFDALAALTGRRSGRHMVRSASFSTAHAGAALELTGPLVNGFDSDELPTVFVTVEPSQLTPAQTEFSLSADATGRRGGTYWGKVVASIPGAQDSVPVWITVA